MTTPFVIKSSKDGLALEMSIENSDCVIAKVSGTGLQAGAPVYTYMSQGIGQYFGDLANNWKGWQGKKEWSSLEGELKLKASCDHLGHIFLSVHLINGAPPIWEIQADLTLEAGQLENLATEARAFEAVAFNAANNSLQWTALTGRR